MFSTIQSLMRMIKNRYAARGRWKYVRKTRQILYLLAGLLVSPLQLTIFLVLSLLTFNAYKLIHRKKPTKVFWIDVFVFFWKIENLLISKGEDARYFWKKPMRYFSRFLSGMSEWNGQYDRKYLFLVETAWLLNFKSTWNNWTGKYSRRYRCRARHLPRTAPNWFLLSRRQVYFERKTWTENHRGQKFFRCFW